MTDVLRARQRRPATFVVEGKSPVFGEDTVWQIQCSTEGVRARRVRDGKTVRLDWRTVVGAALYYGKEIA